MSEPGTVSRSSLRGARPPEIVVLSGATGGVGEVVAEHLASVGAKLVLPVRSDLQCVRERFPEALVVQADLLDVESTGRVAKAARELHGSVDAVVNLAGGFATGSALELKGEELEHQLDLNLRTAVHLTGAFLSDLVERGSGAIVGISAGAAARGGKRQAAYAASKAALEGYLRSVRLEVEPQGVAVSLLVPEGTIDTPANRADMPDADPAAWISPQAVAQAVWYLASRHPGGQVGELRLHA